MLACVNGRFDHRYSKRIKMTPLRWLHIGSKKRAQGSFCCHLKYSRQSATQSGTHRLNLAPWKMYVLPSAIVIRRRV